MKDLFERKKLITKSGIFVCYVDVNYINNSLKFIFNNKLYIDKIIRYLSKSNVVKFE